MVSEKINSVRDLDVYKLAFEAAMEIFRFTKNFVSHLHNCTTTQLQRVNNDG